MSTQTYRKYNANIECPYFKANYVTTNTALTSSTSTTLSGTTTINDTLHVTGSQLNDGNVNITGYINCDNNVTITGGLSAGGNTSLTGAVGIGGAAVFNSSVQFPTFGAWTPDSNLPNGNFGGGSRGYYVFPGGLCVNFGYFGTATSSFTYLKPLTYVYTAYISREGAIPAGGYGPRVNNVGTTSIGWDSDWGSTTKSNVYILVIGKVAT